MVKPIVKDPILLSQPSVPAAEEDRPIARDLLDTLAAHRERCAGMAANMIGELKRIIVFEGEDGDPVLMYNPEIIKKSEPYQAAEGCLSLEGLRSGDRWKTIKVRFQNGEFKTRVRTYKGFTAQVIQHEIDHCNGVLI